MSPREKDGRWARRDALRGALCALAALTAGGSSSMAHGFGLASRQDIGELVLSSGTLSRPNAWIRLLFELIQTTSVDAEPRAVLLKPSSPELFAHPFCVLIGDGALPRLSGPAVEQLSRYLSHGGFLLFDDASGDASGPFARSVSALCAQLFPTRPLAPLPADHSVFRAFFLLDRPLGRVADARVLEGVTVGPVTPVMYCANDLSGALDRQPDGRDTFPVVPGGEAQRREAIKLGINLLMYSLTSNYKHDQAHVVELMNEGRIE